jgi:Tol biopolymer transport system component
MLRLRFALWAASAAAVLAMVAPATAGAFYGFGAQIVSADFQRLEQGDDGTVFAAISAAGRYVAIQTRARNFFADDDPDPPGQFRAGGIFRFDTQTRALELVADGDLRDEATNALVLRGAQNPSISADGRFVAFSTARQLVPADSNGNVDVYVRDMTVPIRAAGAFDLVSAKDGGDVPASYEAPASPIPSGDLGSDVTRGAAISHDGSKVVFRVTEPASDLPDRPGIQTPGFQVFVRDRDADTTTLVTTTIGTGQPAGGAIGAAGISGDGSTVVWTGQNAPLQTEFVNGENTELPGFSYYLWRRIADGPAAPTRRITGLSDPEDPACEPAGPVFFDEFTAGPCFGPLGRSELGISANTNLLPALSSNGRIVAYLTNSGPRPNTGSGIGLDLFVTDMSPGLTRKASTVELTREGADGTAESAPIESVGMSADGRRLAFVTARTKFTLPALSQMGAQRAVPDAQDLYVVDLQARTVERATRSVASGDIDSPVVGEPTLSGDGGRIAFVSFASNLFFGDANQRSDAFVIEQQPDPGAELPGGGLGGDLGSTIETDSGGPQIRARANSKADGVVELTVSVPAAGGVRALAKARVGEPPRVKTLATAKGRSRGTKRSTVRLILRPVSRYREELRRRGEIRGRAIVTFVAARGGRRAVTTREIVFRQQGAPLRKRPVTGWKRFGEGLENDL